MASFCMDEKKSRVSWIARMALSQNRATGGNEVMQTRKEVLPLKEIKAAYGLDRLLVEDQAGGLSALNVTVLSEHSAFILKKYRAKEEEKVVTIENIAQFLQQQKLPVEVPLATKIGKRHLFLQGHFWALYPKVEGVVLHEASLLEKPLTQAASLLARFHVLGSKCSLALPHLSQRFLAYEEVEKRADETRLLIERNSLGHDVDAVAHRLIQAKLDMLENVIDKDLFSSLASSKDLVHGDFHNENLLFDPLGKAVRLLDFEEVHFGDGIEDVLNFILLGCCNSGFESANLEKANCFFRAYQKSLGRPLDHVLLPGMHYVLFRHISSFFLEKELYHTKDLFLCHLLQRDLKGLDYFKHYLPEFLEAISL
jgi:Ser/Thr protein kinase RdoA (MazF antagonist)